MVKGRRVVSDVRHALDDEKKQVVKEYLLEKRREVEHARHTYAQLEDEYHKLLEKVIDEIYFDEELYDRSDLL
jgi:ribose 5-phosphate isomerase RpiB